MFLYVGRHSKSNNFQKRYNYNNRFEMPKRGIFIHLLSMSYK